MRWQITLSKRAAIGVWGLFSPAKYGPSLAMCVSPIIMLFSRSSLSLHAWCHEAAKRRPRMSSSGRERGRSERRRAWAWAAGV